jgi:cob(I)alamin adenosyltransferase
MLYTGKGDNWKTTTFGCNQKISKSSAITEALGCMDEVNSFLGFIKVKVQELATNFPFVIPVETGIQSAEINLGHEYFSTEKSLDPDSTRQSPSLSSGPIPSSTPQVPEDDKQERGTLNKDDLGMKQIVENIQQNLFIIQAEVAGSDMKISEDKLRECEKLIGEIEKELPPIKTFFISGGTELASLFDFARTLVRRAERRVVDVFDQGQNVNEFTLAYLNRLSSLLYALARYSNHIAQITEESPNYK